VNLNDLLKANSDAIDSLKEIVAALDKMKDSLPTEDQFVVIATISDLQTRIRTLEFTRVHLMAGRIVIDFDEVDLARLQLLGAQLDAHIVHSAQLNAILASLPPIMTAAVQIDGLINSHIARA
jgi:hypothetical protein